MKNLFKLFLTVLILALSPLTAQETPYVILISFDGFRWDYPSRGITPNFDEIRENGVAAVSLEPVYPSKTFPNHLSIITGMYPENHGIILNEFSDPFSGARYRMSDTTAIRDGKWYLGEAFWETAERQGITTASYFWPGSELHDPARRPTYRELYEHNRPYEERIAGVLRWLQLPPAERPHFITLYFHETDTQGHNFGPDAPETNQAIQRLDSMLGLLIEGLEKIGMRAQTNLIVVSDHGMTAVNTEKIVNIEKILEGRDPRDAWVFTQRICGVCTTVHAITSVRAVTRVSMPPRRKVMPVARRPSKVTEVQSAPVSTVRFGRRRACRR